MNSSLIPERPILVYPSLAATLGLEESVLLSVLADLCTASTGRSSNGYLWHNLSCDQVLQATPFWNSQDIARISRNLHAKGVLLLGANTFGSGAEFRFAFNERAVGRTQPQTGAASQDRSQPPNIAQAQAPAAVPEAGKNYIAPNWQPDRNTLLQLAQHNIPDSFSLDQLAEFVTYWRERAEPQRSWGSKFIKHVIFQWRQFEAQRNRQEQNSPMYSDWRPSEDAMEVLTVHAGIRREFVEDAIPEFILYWQERGDALKTWNSKFIQHVRVQWKKYTAAVENSTDPRPIPANWLPSEDVYDVLRLANIDTRFAAQLIPEFVLYWRDSNQVHTSWNTRFLQHVKWEWARRHSLNTANTETRSTREITLEEELADRSWAL